MTHSRPVRPDSNFTLALAGNGVLAVSGALDFATVAAIQQAARDYFRDTVAAPEAVDLAMVTSADSAGLSLLIEWVRMAREQHRSLKFLNLPPQLLPLAGLFGVEHLLQPAGDQ